MHIKKPRDKSNETLNMSVMSKPTSVKSMAAAVTFNATVRARLNSTPDGTSKNN